MIIRPYEMFIAIRFLIKGRFQTLLILLGIAVGVAVQFFLSALIGGLQISLIERTVGTAPHILVLPPDSFPVSLGSSDKEIFDFKKVPFIENQEILSWQQYVNYFKNNPEVIAACAVAGGQGL